MFSYMDQKDVILMDHYLTIIIPTYNEELTIGPTIGKISEILDPTHIPYEILIVDDSSRDTTAEIVGHLSGLFPVRLRIRTIDRGLSQSVVEGFRYAAGDIIVVTDADQSHDLSIIPQMYQEIVNGTDIVIGSRYLPEGGIVDWPLSRRVISFGATFLARLLFPELTDPVSGFFAVKKDIAVNAPLKPRGYKILLELLGKSNWQTVKELPYTFTNRKEGESKLKTNTIMDYIFQVINIFQFPGHAQEERRKLIRFMCVGLSGIVVNMFLLSVFKDYFGLSLMLSSIIAIETSILTNFSLNDIWTFGDDNTKLDVVRRLISFNGISIGGMLINITVLTALTSLGMYYIFANLAGILVAFGWNFVVNRHITWKRKVSTTSHL